MIKDSLVRKGHPALSRVAEEVQAGELLSLRKTITEMVKVMTFHKGIGLAANQIGILKRIIVIHVNGLQLAIVNPTITKYYGGKVTNYEECLSYPSVRTLKVRSKQIIVEGFTPDWKPIKRKLKGLAARCVQHEVDHLNGVTIDR